GLTTAYIFSTPVTGDITLHAKWITQYTVTFNSNGGSSVSNQTVNEGVAASRPANPTRAGYTFNDWYSDSGLTIVYNFSTSVTSNITLYAKWDAIPTYTVTFNSNGGSSISNQTVNEGATASRPLPPPILAGYIFDDWYSDSGLTTVYNFSTTITNNTTLYAKWIIIPPVSFTITFDSHGGSHIDPITVTNIPIVLPEPTRQGYEFIAWYVSEGVVFDVDTALDGDITVYALWKINF
ncbi:MAG: InlB B-repeat-containing protein, partial [Treponema sp.]|nr:InlB B-repeat-containing protein [Treponema sp.]